ncbi:ABC transporter family protein [Prunus dulcis]|uniref:ABC transporter family protein n=1 Tax=Prunus dulcis TaxID=3755 RepID=A0A4Y1RL63_PRUDU|nr:ABC transporter family protein [Prunus dulcis]
MHFFSLPLPRIAGQDTASYDLATELVLSRYSNLTPVFKDELQSKFSFCIVDIDEDWDGAFNFSKDSRFISNCAKKMAGGSIGEVLGRLCTAAEMKLYSEGLLQSGKTSYLKPNKNCNLSSWVSGCEPGWACGSSEKVDPKNRSYVPVRSNDCAPCCEGFFCPHGLTCMLPCPKGAYCPFAKLNNETDTVISYLLGSKTILVEEQISGLISRVVKSYSVRVDHIVRLPSKKILAVFLPIADIIAGKVPHLRNSVSGWRLVSHNQKIKILLHTAGLIFILLIIYNCSDQVLATREKRQAKSREKAVQSVRETAQAREKWKSAKDIAKKHAVGLSSQFSRTFSRRKSTRHSDQLKGLGQAKPGTDAALPPMPPNEQSAGTSKGKKKDKSSLTQMIHAIEEDPNSHEGFNLEIGDKNIKKQTGKAPKGKQLHTQSQIFKYAYGQIEKEKALQEQNANLTFSGVIQMAGDTEISKRPPIEVAFKDLTLTLKGKNKHLMRCVTGKISPGRVSAVMGPSGAGKTTFLSALAGKIRGCTMSGMILVNGKMESIHSYKKIIGFVPQDDIVHGNLTVEENLWFSARCRLSADLPKPEKVLVVERVIESLGLQAVRDSLVGTVERRGISGGQRKRVNVGLEMVMEPSLLILDEPTSALEGVNICMVVHQPSYTLFKMFDDLILLAKGGLTVYHGSVKKVEEYFATLGITVPERVNPPDYFIDILEGIVKPSTSSGVTYKQLPVRWMLHNGYPVPMDMLQSSDGMAASAGENSAHGGSTPNAGSDGQSFAGDFWQDVKCHVEVNKDALQHNFLKSSDLSERITPGVFQQYRYFLGRGGKQRLREARTQAVDFLILLIAGVCLGTLAKVSDETFGAIGYTYTVIAVYERPNAALLCKIAALRTFGLDKLHYWRESSSGMSSLAYFLSRDTIDLFNTIIKPLVYLSMFYFFNNPRSSVIDNFIVLLCLVYCVTGIAYALAIYLAPGPAQLWSVLLPVVLTLIANYNENKFVSRIADLCYTKWALEAFVIANAKRYSGVWLITRCGSLMKTGYDLNHWYRSLIFLIITGMVSRCIAYLLLVLFQKK